MAQIRVSIVTPEATTFEESVDGVVLPMYDGEMGILSGHAPLIGRLAPGELRAHTGSAERRFYVEGGFVQVANNLVSVLTGRSIPAEKIDLAAARAALVRAQAPDFDQPEGSALKRKAIDQASAQVRIAEK